MTPIPEHLQRYHTGAAIDALAERFNLPNTSLMQDWQWEVSDPERLNEFLEAYESGELSDDEKFTLMETILESFEELAPNVALDPRWHRTLDHLDRNIDLHACSVYYWSDPENENPEDQFHITQHIRPILTKHRSRLENP